MRQGKANQECARLWSITYVPCYMVHVREIKRVAYHLDHSVPTLKNPLAGKSRELTLRSISIHWLIDSLNIVNDDAMIEKL